MRQNNNWEWYGLNPPKLNGIRPPKRPQSLILPKEFQAFKYKSLWGPFSFKPPHLVLRNCDVRIHNPFNLFMQCKPSTTWMKSPCWIINLKNTLQALNHRFSELHVPSRLTLENYIDGVWGQGTLSMVFSEALLSNVVIFS